MSFPFDQVRHLLVDLDGVLYRGDAPLPHAADFIGWLRRRGIAFRLVTNNAALTPPQYVDKLGRMGIAVQPDEIFTSALATGMYLRQHAGGTSTAHVVGEEGLRRAVEEAGLHLTDGRADWVVVGLDRHVTYERLAGAALALEAGARFVGTNPDTSYPTERGLMPGAGALIQCLRVTTGIVPLIIGKPEPLLLELALDHLGATPADSAMLGDRLDTDIQAATTLDMPSILVLTGVSTRQELEHSAIQPTLVVDTLQVLMKEWGSAAPIPNPSPSRGEGSSGG